MDEMNPFSPLYYDDSESEEESGSEDSEQAYWEYMEENVNETKLEYHPKLDELLKLLEVKINEDGEVDDEITPERLEKTRILLVVEKLSINLVNKILCGIPGCTCLSDSGLWNSLSNAKINFDMLNYIISLGVFDLKDPVTVRKILKSLSVILESSGTICYKGKDDRLHKLTIFMISWLREHIPIEMCSFNLLPYTLHGHASMEKIRGYFDLILQIYIDNGQKIPEVSIDTDDPENLQKLRDLSAVLSIPGYDEEDKIQEYTKSLGITLYKDEILTQIAMSLIDIEMLEKYLDFSPEDHFSKYYHHETFYSNSIKDEAGGISRLEFRKRKYDEVVVFYPFLPYMLTRLSSIRNPEWIRDAAGIIQFLFSRGYDLLSANTITNTGRVISMQEILDKYRWRGSPIEEVLMPYLYDKPVVFKMSFTPKELSISGLARIIDQKRGIIDTLISPWTNTFFMEHSTMDELFPDSYYSGPKYSDDDESRWQNYEYVDDLYTQVLNKYEYYKSCKDLMILEGEMQVIYDKSGGGKVNDSPYNHRLEHSDLSSLHRFFEHGVD